MAEDRGGQRWYPLCFGAFPVLYLYAANPEHATLSAIWIPLALVSVVIAGVGFVIRRLLGDRDRAAIATSVIAILAMTYGHAWQALENTGVGDIILVPVWLLLGTGGVILASRVSSRRETTRIVKGVGLIMVALMTYQAGVAWWGQRPQSSTPRVRAAIEPNVDTTPTDDMPDIYYLIFDRYGGASSIERNIKYDNTPFLDQLRDRGFYVADRSVSNYPKTVSSLASSLNMNYINAAEKIMGRRSPNWTPLYDMMLDSAVARELKGLGYHYTFVGSPWDWLAADPSADENLHYRQRVPDFLRPLLSTTIARPLVQHIGPLSSLLDWRRFKHETSQWQFSAIADQAKRTGPPRFVFSHLLMPHDPYTYDADGNWVSQDTEDAGKWWEHYEHQLRYTNTKMLEMLDALLAGPDDPIVIIQADEGIYPHNIFYGLSDVDWAEAPASSIHDKFPIMNAFYFPDGRYDDLRRTITPVNTFRVVFNTFFEAGMPYLKEDMYVFGDGHEPYEFRRVTNIVR